MAEYIERGAAVDAACNAVWCGGGTPSIARAINKVLAADVGPVQRWISVKDALPEGDDCDGVLVLVSGQYRNITFDHAYELAEYDAVEGEWILEAYPEWENPGVTHWMPLPELPEEERA